MSEKWDIEEITEGTTMQTTFEVNPVGDSPYRYKASHLDGRQAPKVVLCNDPRIRPGASCRVKIRRILKKKRPDRGWIEVEYVADAEADIQLEEVYVDNILRIKLRILLDSGLNILLDGPQGCGKTVLARRIAAALDMKFVFFNCGAVVEATDFLATIQVRASETGQPVTDFIKTEILISLEEAIDNPGVRYLIFLDEFNRCQESARNALMPALDSTRRIFHPIENRFIQITENVQFIAAVNRGNEFSGTFGIDAAQLDRFAPLQMDYLPPEEEIELLRKRHPELGKATIEQIVEIADRIRHSPELGAGLSVRATGEACVYLEHPLMREDRRNMLPEVLKSSFCGRFSGRWDDVSTDAGAAWALVQNALREDRKKR